MGVTGRVVGLQLVQALEVMPLLMRAMHWWQTCFLALFFFWWIRVGL